MKTIKNLNCEFTRIVSDVKINLFMIKNHQLKHIFKIKMKIKEDEMNNIYLFINHNALKRVNTSIIIHSKME